MAEIIYARLGELAYKAESTKGTKVVDANLVDGTNSKVAVYDLAFRHINAIGERNRQSAHLSRFSHTVGTTFAEISFKIDVRKTAAVGSDDAYTDLLRACGMYFTANVYGVTTDQSAHKTLTMYAFIGSDGTGGTNCVRRGIRGAAGNVRFVGNVGERAVLEFTFTGVHETADSDGTPTNTFALKPTDDALNSVSHEAGVALPFMGVSLTYDSLSVVVPTFTFDLGNEVVMRESVSSSAGGLHACIVNRKPMIEIDPDAELVFIKNYFGNFNLGTEVAVGWAYAVSASRTWTFAAPKAQIEDAQDGNRNGIQTCGLKLACNRSAEGTGDAEFTITES